MNTKRIKAIAKLGLLFGTPLALLFALFAWGVHFGALHRDGITQFERDWLGLDVEVAPPFGESDGKDGKDGPKKDEAQTQGDGSEGAEEGGAPDRDQPDERPDRSDSDRSDEARDSRDDAERDPGDDPGDAPPQPPAGESDSSDVEPSVTEAPAPRVDPLAGELAQRLQLPVTIEIKVLVDPALADARPEWIDYVQRSVAEASRIYQKQFGIELEVVGVGQWPTAVAGLGAQELLQDLQARPREAGQILVGLTAHELDDVATDVPGSGDPFNGAYAVVGPIEGHGQPHLRGLLREISRLLGARAVTDPGHPDYQAGSWMRNAPVAESQAPWIDAANRQRILERKDRPFRPESSGVSQEDE